MLKEWFAQQDPEHLRRSFYALQAVAGVIGLAAFVWIRSRRDSSGFRDGGREWQRGPAAPGSKKPALNSPRSGRTAPSGPALLTGIRIGGAPHEVLGVPADASEAAIQQAYRDLMKRYHPDKLGTPGSPQWKEGQRIAEAINQARDRMLKR